jgi:photosystem II stability/assembly factor-like uncharacterized protein
MSTNGTSWSVAPLDSSVNLWSVGFGNGLFVAVGDNGTILTADDEGEWTASDSGTTNTLEGVAYGNGVYVVTGINGAILNSPDADTWSVANSHVNDDLCGATFANGVFVVVGANGTILTSTDGTNWTSRGSGTIHELLAVAYGNGRFVAIGTSGVIVQSDPVIGPQLAISVTPSGGAQVSVNGWAGLTYRVDASTNCRDWVALTNLSLTTATGQYIDSSAPNFNQRFYRAVQ